MRPPLVFALWMTTCAGLVFAKPKPKPEAEPEGEAATVTELVATVTAHAVNLD